jgi:amidase
VERIEARNPRLNAVVHRLYERARMNLSRLPEGPLRGVPFLLKDLGVQLEGTPTTDSTRLGSTQRASGTSVLVARYEDAGLQILGKTNTPEFGIMGITEPELRGPCRNPWDPDRTPGGSSGGAAAAVAARMVPAAHASDGGGSIRIPSSACGLFGLKPSRGRVSTAPFAGESWSGLSQEHVVSRSVRDSATLLDIVDGAAPGDPYAAPPKTRPWVEEAASRPRKLRIGFTREALLAGKSFPDCVAAVNDAVRLLQDLGHEVIEAPPVLAREDLVRAYFRTVACHVARNVELAAARVSRKPHASDFEPATWLLAIVGRKTTGPELLEAREVMQRAGYAMAAFHAQHRLDLLLTSTLARPPARVGELAIKMAERTQIKILNALPVSRLIDIALGEMGKGRIEYTPNTQLFNQTGQPAMSVPLFWSAEGLPIGVQFAARYGDEATLLQLAAALEEARPWAGRRPALL